jgi:hypothetical protein
VPGYAAVGGDTVTPLEQAQSAARRARAAAAEGDCAAAEAAKDDAMIALELSARESAEVIGSHPHSPEADVAREATREVGAIYSDVCLDHCRARVQARRRTTR